MSDTIYYNSNPNPYVKPSNRCAGFGLVELIYQYKNPVGIEIGTDDASTAAYLLATNPHLFLHTIDPYEAYIDWNGNNMNETNRKNTWNLYLNKMQKYIDENRTLHHMEYSDTAVSKFDDESVDFVFIDGLHTYEQVLIDCHNYYPKVKPGGIISGHDFNVIEGVNRAVKEFASEVGKNILQTQYDVWYWIK
jgi:predicted O-methyltransferase YrrM